MGLATLVKNLFLRELESVHRPPQVYSNAAPGPDYDIYVIHGGLVLITGIVAVADTGIAAITTMFLTVDGVAINAAAAITSTVGDVIPFPLDASGADVLIPNIACQPNPTLAGNLAEGSHAGLVAGPGNIVVTCGVAAMVAPESLSFRIHYRRIDPWASIRLT